jgi:glycosyltransferase involved in cell wall biosynthesis
VAQRLDVVLPCYHPVPGWAENLEASYREVRALLPGHRCRLIVVNDGSARGISAQETAWLHDRIPELVWLEYAENQGKGHALRYGMSRSDAPLCVFTDVDFPYTPQSFAAVVRALEQGADLALGNRDAQYYAQVPPFRKFVSRALRWLVGRFLRLPVTDTQCGLKGFNARGRAVFLQTQIKRYLFDLELVFLVARKPGWRIVPVPVELRPGIVFSKMSARVLLRESWSLLRILFRAAFR